MDTDSTRKNTRKSAAEVVTAYKGFDLDLQCRGFQFKVGETYEHEGEVKACVSGFHSCEYPLDVFYYYPPAGNRFAEVRPSGQLSRSKECSKIVSSIIKVETEITPSALASRAVDWILSKVDASIAQTRVLLDPFVTVADNTFRFSVFANEGSNSHAANIGQPPMAMDTGEYSLSANTGSCSAAINMGERSASTNVGLCSVAANTGRASVASNKGAQSLAGNSGKCSAAMNEGDYSISANTGDRSLSANTGGQSLSAATGNCSKAVNEGQQSASVATGWESVASNKGEYSLAANTGEHSAAMNEGDYSISANTGESSEAVNKGPCSASVATGHTAIATTTGRYAVAASLGINGCASAGDGGGITLCYRDEEDGRLIHIRSTKIGENGTKPGVLYELNAQGEFVEVKDEKELAP